LLWPVGLLIRLWGMSLRFELSPADRQAYTKRDVPVAMVLWHNRLFLAAEIVRRFRGGRPAYALVSASQDGAWLTAFFFPRRHAHGTRLEQPARPRSRVGPR
jgi:hypothetical protein